MRHRMRWAAMVTAGAIVAVALAPGTDASTQLGCRWPDAPIGPTSIRYSAADEPAALRQVWAAAAQRWTASGGNVAFVEDPIAHTVTADSADFGNVGFDGLIQYTCLAGFFVPRQVRVGLNTFYTDSYPTGMRLSVAGHELGHATGLGHEDRSDCRARPLMFSSSARWTQCGIEAPTADDTAGTRGLYP